MVKNRTDERSPESLDNTSYSSEPSYRPSRTVEEIEREEAEEKMAINAGAIIMGGWPFYARKDVRQRAPEEEIALQYGLDDIIPALNRFDDIILALKDGAKFKTSYILKKNK